MRLALAERAGLAHLHLDLRRGDGPPGARSYNFAAPATKDALVEQAPEVTATAVRATQDALKDDPSLARNRLFHGASIGPAAIDGLNRFAIANRLTDRPLAPGEIVTLQFSGLWTG